MLGRVREREIDPAEIGDAGCVGRSEKAIDHLRSLSLELVVVDLVIVIVLGRADREQRRTRYFSSATDGEDRRSLGIGQRAPELVERLAETGECGRISLLGEQTRAEHRVVLQRIQED